MKKITCIVDNTVKRQSPLWGEHGLAFGIETDRGLILLDTGTTESVLWHNLGALGWTVRDVSALAISHAHRDHTGALAAVLSQKPGLPVHAHPDLFRPRFALRENGYRSIGLPLTPEEMAQWADLQLSDVPVEMLPGVWTTGEITERAEPEGRSARHFVPGDDGWQSDTYRDDMSLVVETRAGVIVVCGCCHAGLLNTLAHVRRVFQRPVSAILGGIHLMDAGEAHVHRVVEVLRDIYGSPRLYLNHCTGESAYVALASAFGERVQACPAGTTLTFE